MENENFDYENSSPEEASSEINKILNNPEHLYHSKHGTPGRDKAIEDVQRLFAIKNPEPEPQVNEQGEVLSNPIPQAVVDTMAEGLAIKENRDEKVQEKRIGQANIARDKLNDLGYEAAPIRDDISAGHVEALDMSVLVAEEDFDNLTPMFTKNLRELKNISQSVHRQHQTYLDCSEHETTLKKKMAFIIVHAILEAHKQMEGI